MEVPHASAEELNAHVTNQDIHFTSTERIKLNSIEEGANKLEPLVGTTTEITPTQVATAVLAGRPVSISHTDAIFGTLKSNAFTFAQDLGSIIATSTVLFGGRWIAVEIDGALSNNTWNVHTSIVTTYDEAESAFNEINTILAEKSDKDHNHDSDYDAKGSAESALNSANAYTDECISSINESFGTVLMGMYGNDIPDDGNIPSIREIANDETTTIFNSALTSLKGKANGIAELDSDGKVPTSQLPSYVDDVLEYTAKASFPTTGETGKIYVDTATNKTYRWSGSTYTEISASLALGTTSSTAYRGDYGNIAYDHSQKTSGNPHGVTKSDVGLSNVENVRQYSTNNPPPYPVTSVAGKTGAVTLAKSDVGLGNVDNTADASKTVSKANTLTTARKIGLIDGVTSTATEFNGSTDISIPVTDINESYLSWGGKVTNGKSSPIDDIAIGNVTNCFAFLPQEAVTIEYTRDGGQSWTSSASGSITGFIPGINGTIYSLAKPYTINDKIRVTIDNSVAKHSCTFKKLLFDVYILGVSANVIIEHFNNDTITSTKTYPVSMKWNSVPYTSNFTYAHKLRFTFEITETGTHSNPGFTIQKIIGLGQPTSVQSNLARTNHLYSFDANQNATFPAKLIATEFTKSDGSKLITTSDLSKSSVGLGNVVNTGDSATPVSGGTTKFTTGGAYTELAKKVDKTTTVNGHALSGNVTVTKSDIGLGNVENKSSATIRGELTKTNVTDALGYTPPTQDTVYTHPSYTAKSSGLYKVTVDAAGHVSNTTAVTKADITGLGIPAQDTVYTLPAAGASLGGVKSGGDVTISDGIITVNDDSHNHIIENIDNLQDVLDGKVSTSRTINGKPLGANITLDASDVGAESSGAVSTHNTSTAAHNDIRLLIEGLTTRLNTLANSTDEDLDQLAEIVAYIKANKELIDSITTSKVNVADIVNNLTTNVNNKPLSAAQGVVIKGLIDDLAAVAKSGKYSDLTGTPTIDTVLSNTSTNAVQNKVIYTALDSKASATGLTSHTSNTSNPHSVTKSQVGLGNVDNTADANKTVAKANQLTTARNIALRGGVTGTATSFNGTNDISIPVTDIKESYISWGGKTLKSGSTPFDDIVMGNITNCFAFLPLEGVTAEYTRDGGETWTSTSISGTFFLPSLMPYSLGLTKPYTTNDKIRITIDNSISQYSCTLQKLLLNMYCIGVSANAIIEYFHNDTLRSVKTEAIGSSWNSIPVNYTFYPAYKLRITIEITEVQEHNNPGFRLSNIIGLGQPTSGSNMAKSGHLYSYDVNQNATFPAKVSSPEFVENGTSLDDKYSSIAHTHDVATASTAGLMSSSDKAKLDGIKDGAGGLPTVTIDNNGSFLRVVDGAWAAVQLPNVEDGEF